MNRDASPYQAITQKAGWVDLSERTKLELTGADRATFLHNLCTNEIRTMTPGSGCEAFVTNVQGKVLAYVLVFCGPDSLVIDTVAEQAELLSAHFDRYLIREDVQIHDRTNDWGELLLAGDRAGEVLRHIADHELPPSALNHQRVNVGTAIVDVVKTSLTGGTGVLLRCDRDATATLSETLSTAGAACCDAEAFDTARIEAATPVYGRDITDANLPQEVGRNRLAISFTKGCYLGQETVARIDALGHVNQTLCSVRFDSAEAPPVGTELAVDGKAVGRVTSSTFSPALDAPLALAYVRRGHSDLGSRLSSDVGVAEVIAPPR